MNCGFEVIYDDLVGLDYIWAKQWALSLKPISIEKILFLLLINFTVKGTVTSSFQKEGVYIPLQPYKQQKVAF